MSARYVYRAEARYDDARLDSTRHFLTKKARDRWAKQRREGYPEDPGGFLDDGRPAIPPAREVVESRSEPVIFA